MLYLYDPDKNSSFTGTMTLDEAEEERRLLLPGYTRSKPPSKASRWSNGAWVEDADLRGQVFHNPVTREFIVIESVGQLPQAGWVKGLPDNHQAMPEPGKRARSAGMKPRAAPPLDGQDGEQAMLPTRGGVAPCYCLGGVWLRFSDNKTWDS